MLLSDSATKIDEVSRKCFKSNGHATYFYTIDGNIDNFILCPFSKSQAKGKNEFVVWFVDEDDARKVFSGVPNENESGVYTCLIGPNGILSENT